MKINDHVWYNIYIYICTYDTDMISYAHRGISGDPQPLGGSKLSGRSVAQSLSTWHAFNFQQWANHLQIPWAAPINSHKPLIISSHQNLISHENHENTPHPNYPNLDLLSPLTTSCRRPLALVGAGRSARAICGSRTPRSALRPSATVALQGRARGTAGSMRHQATGDKLQEIDGF